jgi:hypothetical protein
VVDYSAQPAFRDSAAGFLIKLDSGDIVTLGVLKKSWLQGSPWVLAGFLAILLAWSRREFVGELGRRHLRMMTLPLVSLLAIFGLAGVFRHDGVSFNQRYLLELAPLMAIAVGVGFSRLDLRWPSLVAGSVLGGVAAATVLVAFNGTLGFRVQSIAPLCLACVAACLWLFSLSRPRWCGPAGLAVAACLSWSLVIHLATDLRASRELRAANAARLDYVEDTIPQSSPAALLSASGEHVAFCPLLLDHDLVVAARREVPSNEVSAVLDALLERRRVFVWLERLSFATVAQLQSRYRMNVVLPGGLAELTLNSDGEAPRTRAPGEPAP